MTTNPHPLQFQVANTGLGLMWGQMQRDKIATTNSAKCHVILHIIIVVISQIDSNANLPTQASFRQIFDHIITSAIFYVPRWHVSPVVFPDPCSFCQFLPAAPRPAQWPWDPFPMAPRAMAPPPLLPLRAPPPSSDPSKGAKFEGQTKGLYVVKESYYVTLYVQYFSVYDSYVTWICKYEPWINVYVYIYTIINIYIYMVQICSNVDVYDLDVCPRLRTILTYIPSSRTITYTVKCRTSV